MHPVLFQIGPLLVPSYGVCVAAGVLMALALAQSTARTVALPQQNAPRQAWNMLVLAVFAALATSRLLLLIVNAGEMRKHPSWMLSVAMVHHPLLTAAEAAGAAVALLWYVAWARLPWAAAADCLAAPAALGIAAEQVGAMLAGSDFGRESSSAWAVSYTSPLAARWSGTPIGMPLYPVQAYAALGALALAAVCFGWLLLPHRQGDAAGVGLIGGGVLLFLTENYRDWEGRGVLFDGRIDIPQLVGLAMAVCGGLVLWDWRGGKRNHV